MGIQLLVYFTPADIRVLRSFLCPSYIAKCCTRTLHHVQTLFEAAPWDITVEEMSLLLLRDLLVSGMHQPLQMCTSSDAVRPSYTNTYACFYVLGSRSQNGFSSPSLKEAPARDDKR